MKLWLVVWARLMQSGCLASFHFSTDPCWRPICLEQHHHTETSAAVLVHRVKTQSSIV